MSEQRPEPVATAVLGVLHSVLNTFLLLARRRTHLRRASIGQAIHFADGTAAQIYRETVVDETPYDPCILVVAFTLRWVRGRGHTVFRWESILNTPLFVGFDGFVSKLWLANDQSGRYRGIYEWNGPGRAEFYARCLWRVLALVSVPGSIGYLVIPGIDRDRLLGDSELTSAVSLAAAGDSGWWRPVDVR